MPKDRFGLKERKNELLAGGPSSPEDELELVDLGVQLSALDERATMFDPDTAPRPPDPKEEGVTSLDGTRTVDMQRDTPTVDDLASFDLSTDDLYDVDL